MRRLGIDPFLLNFITLGVIMTLMILSIISIYQHGETEDKLSKQSDYITKQDSKKLYGFLEYQFEVIRSDIREIQDQTNISSAQDIKPVNPYG